MAAETAKHVHGLVVFPIPTPNGELTRLVRAYGHALGDAGGDSLLWRPIGDPRRIDAVYRGQRTRAMERADKIAATKFDAGATRSGSKRHYVQGEYQRAIRWLGLRQRDLPAILFLALGAVNRRAILHVDYRLFDNGRRKKALADLLVEELSEERVLRFAANGIFTSASMDKLQRYLTSVERKTTRLVLVSQATAGGKVAPDRSRHATSAKQSVDAYATAYSHQGRELPLSKSEYEKCVRNRDKYDFIIDGTTYACFRRAPGTATHQGDSLTPAEFKMIHSYVVNAGFRNPTRYHGGGSSSYRTAVRLFETARKKVDIKTGRYAFLLFQTRRSGPGGPCSFAFVPPEGVSWILIEPRLE